MGSPFEATGAAVKTAHSSLKSANRDEVDQVPERVHATPGEKLAHCRNEVSLCIAHHIVAVPPGRSRR
jgi:hypothetical protein